MLAMPRKYHQVSRHCSPPLDAATGISRGVSLHTLYDLARTIVRCARRRRRVWDEVGWWNGLPLRSSDLKMTSHVELPSTGAVVVVAFRPRVDVLMQC